MNGAHPTTYRKNVAVIVLNEAGKILACRRSDQHRTWQLPQGGVDDGESLEQTLFRELLEEIGTDSVDVIGLLPDSITYEWPPEEYHRGFRGQEQSYFLVRLRAGIEIDLSQAIDHEFDAVCWMGMNEFLTHVSGFKAPAYRQALEALAVLYPETISL